GRRAPRARRTGAPRRGCTAPPTARRAARGPRCGGWPAPARPRRPARAAPRMAGSRGPGSVWRATPRTGAAGSAAAGGPAVPPVWVGRGSRTLAGDGEVTPELGVRARDDVHGDELADL